MKISIITPSFNQGAYIRRTIESVIAQRGNFELEYIIIDGGSTDASLEIIRDFAERDQRIFWISEPDRGQTHAINKGLRRAKGDIVAYLNSDDMYKQDALEKVCQAFERHPDAQWLSGKCTIVDEYDTVIRNPIRKYKNFFLQHYSYFSLLILNYLSQPSTFWRRSLLDDIGYLNEDEHLVMDYEYWCRIGKKYRLCVLEEDLAFFRYYRQSKSGSKFKEQFSRETKIVLHFTKNPLIVILHTLHAAMIIGIYKTLFVFQHVHGKFSNQKSTNRAS